MNSTPSTLGIAASAGLSSGETTATTVDGVGADAMAALLCRKIRSREDPLLAVRQGTALLPVRARATPDSARSIHGYSDPLWLNGDDGVSADSGMKLRPECPAASPAPCDGV